MLRVIIVTELVVALVTGATVVLRATTRSTARSSPSIPLPDFDRPDRRRSSCRRELMNILVLGTDTRDCAGSGIDGRGHRRRSDTTILLHVSADRKSAYGIAIPRDALVDRPDCETADGETIPGERPT